MAATVATKMTRVNTMKPPENCTINTLSLLKSLILKYSSQLLW